VIEGDPLTLPTVPGAYVLELDIPRRLEIIVGRLGTVALDPGKVRYYGSARGPGGLRARLLRHLNPDGRRDRWHIDALTRVIPVSRIWIEPGGHECDLVENDLASGHWRTAVRGFGSSDCRSCQTHLLIRES